MLFIFFFHSCSDSDAKASIYSKECSSALIVNAISGKTTADFFVTFLDCVYLELHTAFLMGFVVLELEEHQNFFKLTLQNRKIFLIILLPLYYVELFFGHQ